MRNQGGREQFARGAAAVVGVDAGKFEHALVVHPKDGKPTKALLFAVTREGFEQAESFIREFAGAAAPAGVLVGIEFGGRCGFTLAQYLDERGYPVVNVSARDVKDAARGVHGRTLKSDKADARVVAEVVRRGQYGAFPFLNPGHAALRYLVSTVERITLQRSAATARLRAALHVQFPEYETVMGGRSFTRANAPILVLQAFPGPEQILKAGRDEVFQVVRKATRGQKSAELTDALMAAAANSLAIKVKGDPLAEEIRCLVAQLMLYNEQRTRIEEQMKQILMTLPEGPFLLTIPSVGALTAAMFCGSVGDVKAYHSVREVLAMAGMSLTVSESGITKGRIRLSKEGRPVMRRYMHLFATRLILKDGPYRERYDKMKAKGKHHNAILVAIARGLLRMMFAVAKRRVEFDPTRLHAHLAAEG